MTTSEMFVMSPQEPVIIEPDYQIILPTTETTLAQEFENAKIMRIKRAQRRLFNFVDWIFMTVAEVLEKLLNDHPARPMFDGLPGDNICIIGRTKNDVSEFYGLSSGNTVEVE